MEYKMFQRNVKSTEEIRHEQKRRLFVSLFFMTMMVILSALSLRGDISTLVNNVFMIASLFGLMCVVISTKTLTRDPYVEMDAEFVIGMQDMQNAMKRHPGEADFLRFIVNVMKKRQGLKLTFGEYQWLQEEFKARDLHIQSASLISEFNLRSREVIGISSHDEQGAEESSHV